jgi:hypothetical protein
MTELWQLVSCFEYKARYNTFNTDSSECLKEFLCFGIGIKTYKTTLLKVKKEVFYSFEPFHIVIHQLLKGLI